MAQVDVLVGCRIGVAIGAVLSNRIFLSNLEMTAISLLDGVLSL